MYSGVGSWRQVLVHQINVTLLTVLSHQSPEGQKEAMQHLVQLKMGAADKQVALRAVRPSGRDFDAELDEAVTALAVRACRKLPATSSNVFCEASYIESHGIL